MSGGRSGGPEGDTDRGVFFEKALHASFNAVFRGAEPPLGALTDAVNAARSRWPTVAFDPEVLGRHWAAFASSTDDLESALRGPHSADMSLAAACADGDAAAIEVFDRVLRGVVSRSVAPERADDVGQQVRSKLLVASGGRPKIAEYGGRGSLEAWTRVVVARAEVDSIRAQREVASEDVLDRWSEVALDESATDPELEVYKRRYRVEFERAFREAIDALSAHHRNVLRQQLLFGMRLSEIGALHDVSDRTIKRWISAARAALRAETARILRARLNLEDGEFTSIVRLIDSQMDVIALPLFRTGGGG